ncbi:MAG: helix-turn-helix domain-containing protein [Firmicutes bacterium]|nr:helix-turn-helix domain-containing protein [Bacillota bacterium]
MERKFYKRLKELRLEKELLQSDVAKAMHVTYNTIGNWERDYSSPSIYELIELANFFEVTTDYLLGRTDLY